MAAAGADYEDSPVHICAWVLHGVGKEGDGWRYEGCIYLFAIFFGLVWVNAFGFIGACMRLEEKA